MLKRPARPTNNIKAPNLAVETHFTANEPTSRIADEQADRPTYAVL